MIWSDMYFAMDSPSHGYYDTACVIPPDVVAEIPKDVQLVYRDYYSSALRFSSRNPLSRSTSAFCSPWACLTRGTDGQGRASQTLSLAPGDKMFPGICPIRLI
jgi:hypothetical protein